MTTPDIEREHWNSKAKMTDPMFEMWADKPNTVQCVNLLLEDLDPAIGATAKILEVGCGMGRLSQAVQDRFLNSTVYGVDISRGLLDLAAKFGEQEIKLPVYLECDGRSLPDGVPTDLDYAYSMVVFQHIPNDVKKLYLQAVYDHLKVGGVFRFQLVEGDEQSDYNHHISQKDIIDMCQDIGYEVQAADGKLMMQNWLWITAVKVPTE